MDEIIQNTIDKIQKDDSSEEMNLTEQFKSKIYEKFNIKNQQPEAIDLVCTYVNPMDLEYQSYKKKSDSSNHYVKKFLEEERTDVYNFFINLKTTRKNLDCIRNIIIITPTPLILNEIFNNDNQVLIIPYRDLTDNPLFRHANVLQYLKKIQFLSPSFLYASQEQFIVKKLEKNNFFKNNLPIIHFQKKSIKKITNIKELEQTNSLVLFKEKFGEFKEIMLENQLMMVRRDVLEITGKLFKRLEVVDYLLLQAMVGNYLGLYVLGESVEGSGFYEYNARSPWGRFRRICDGDVDFYCINYFDGRFNEYVLYGHFINLGYLKNCKRTLKVKMSKRMRYMVASLERRCRKYGIDITYIEKDESGDIQNDIYWYEKDGGEEVDCIKIVGDCSINDLLFFCGGRLSEEPYRKSKIVFPLNFLEKMEIKNGVPYKKFLGLRDNLVKECKLTFRGTLKK